MAILIDGWNLIRCEGSGFTDENEDALDSARALISYLERFQETHNDPIILVFDSTNEFLDTGYRSNDKLKVVASRNADDYIKRYVDDAPERQRRNIRVVSSDGGIYYYVRSAGALPMRSAEFWRRLNRCSS